MKNLLIAFSIALLPVMSYAGKGGNTQKVNIRISTDKNGKVTITDVNKNLGDLEKNLNDALKNVSVKFDDGKKKHEVHFKAEIKID